MHRIDTPGNVAGHFTDGDPLIPQEPTIVGEDWLNAVQEEICNVIEAAGITLNKPTNTQLLAAMRALFGPKMLEAPVTVIDNVSGTLGWTSFDASGAVPSWATAVIVDTRGYMNSGTETGNATLQARMNSGGPIHNILLGGDVGTGSIAYGAQGMIWLDTDRSFEYRIDEQGFTGGLYMRIIGYV